MIFDKEVKVLVDFLLLNLHNNQYVDHSQDLFTYVIHLEHSFYRKDISFPFPLVSKDIIKGNVAEDHNTQIDEAVSDILSIGLKKGKIGEWRILKKYTQISSVQ